MPDWVVVVVVGQEQQKQVQQLFLLRHAQEQGEFCLHRWHPQHAGLKQVTEISVVVMWTMQLWNVFFLLSQAAKPKAAEKDVKIEQDVNGKTKKPIRIFFFLAL